MISGAEPEGDGHIVSAMVPLAKMFGYVNDLRAMTRATGSYEMRFDHYERLPNGVGGPDDQFRPAMAMRA
jgi:elongation factor G